MAAVVNFFVEYIVLIYLFLFLALVIALQRLSKARHEQDEAVFGLELEIARRHKQQAVTGIVFIGLLAAAEFVLVVFLAPALPAMTIFPTGTGNPAALPTNTLPPELLATLNAMTPEKTITAVSSGCIPGQIMITSPEAGEQVGGKITLTGTADIPNFGFYKYEISPIGVDLWTTIQAGREPVQSGSLGDWDTSEVTPGDYLLRLVVTDNQGMALPECIVPIRVINP